VLRELLESGVATVIRLDHVFRQAQRSAIVRAAHDILDGRFPTATPTGQKGDGDLFVIRAPDPTALERRLLSVLDRVSAAYDLDPKRDVMVLSPMRRGPAGVDRLNEILGSALNPGPRTTDDRPPLRPGDKVMQLKNDYERDVFNGDLGEVRRLAGGSTFVEIDGREVQYGPDDLDALALAWACTVHKVQGSEFPAVVVVMHGSHHVLLARALLYTAVTRAKRLVVLLGDERAMRRAVRNALSYASRSMLTNRLRRVTPLPREG
jgi:exodeoxyribonuclease V alpha subunit